MIAKISNGAKFGGLAAYLHGPGRENEHVYGMDEGGQVIGGNLLCEGDRDGHRWSRDMREAASLRPDIEKPVWHMSLRAAPEDPELSDQQWRDVAQRHAEAMGWERQPWVMVRHGQDHVHVVVSRVDFEGSVWNRRNDRYKAREACLAVEKDLGLKSTALERPNRRVERHAVGLSAGEFAKAERTGQAPERAELATVVRAARDHAQRLGGGREAFEAALTEQGVKWRANVASTGRMNGYSFHIPGHVDAVGKPVWLKASDLDRSLGWGRLSKSLTPRAVEVKVPPVEPKRFLESSASHEARVQAATVQAHEQYRAKSAEKMHQQIARSNVGARLYWGARQSQKAAKVKTWALNVHDRSVKRGELAETMRLVRLGSPGSSRPLMPTSATFRAASRGVDFAARAAMEQAKIERRGRGMSR